jgi:hypothetical protein
VQQQADAERRQITEPESEPRQKADIRHVESAQPIVRIDAVTNDGRNQRNRADAVRDRIAGEACKRGDPIGNVGSSDGAQRQQVIKCHAEIRGGYQHRRQRNEADIRVPDDFCDFVGVDVPQRVRQCVDRSRSDGDADENAQAP